MYFTAFRPKPGTDRPMDAKSICGHPLHRTDPHWLCETCKTIPSTSRTRIHPCQTVMGKRKDGSPVILQGAPKAECPQCVKFEPHMRLKWLQQAEKPGATVPQTPLVAPTNLKYRGNLPLSTRVGQGATGDYAEVVCEFGD